MKVVRVLFTIVLALCLFPVIFLSIQGAIAHETIYSTEFVESIARESHLSKDLADLSIELALKAVQERLTDYGLTIDTDALSTSLGNKLDYKQIQETIDDTSLGFHQYYFTSTDHLPTVEIDYLQEIITMVLIETSNQLSDQGIIPDLSSVDTALEAGYAAGIINESSIDSALEYLETQEVPISDEQKDLITDIIVSYESKLADQAIGPNKTSDSFRDILITESSALIELPKTIDFHALMNDIYKSPSNPVTSLKLLTFELPPLLIIIFGALFIGFLLMYLAINRFNIVATFEFLSITGLIAGLLSLFVTMMAYWFIPQGNALQRLLGSDSTTATSAIKFIELVFDRSLSRAIDLNLFIVIAFLLLLIAVEIKKRLYPPTIKRDSTKEVGIQVIITLLIGLILGIFVYYQWQQVLSLTNQYKDILTTYQDYEIVLTPNLVTK